MKGNVTKFTLVGKYTQTSTFLLSQPLHHYLKEA